jgi:hypothetical protein
MGSGSPLGRRRSRDGDPHSPAVGGAAVSVKISSGQLTFTRSFTELGYDSDSRKAEKTYKACEKIAKDLRRLLGDDFDVFASAEH